MNYTARMFRPAHYPDALRIIAKAEGCTCEPVRLPHDQGTDVLHLDGCGWRGEWPFRIWIGKN